MKLHVRVLHRSGAGGCELEHGFRCRDSCSLAAAIGAHEEGGGSSHGRGGAEVPARSGTSNRIKVALKNGKRGRDDGGRLAGSHVAGGDFSSLLLHD